MKSLLAFLSIVLFTQLGMASVSKHFRLVQEGLWRSQIETTLEGKVYRREASKCVSKKEQEALRNQSPGSCSTKFLKDTASEYVAEVKCANEKEGPELTKVTQKWVSANVLVTVIESGGVVTKTTMAYVGPCGGR
ncbi:DUF3617 domain-containing protein [Bdellovibrio sp. HCB-162]|uniref:DUF3617 domain-containing protein n=1 Tax=Bdellovibrio sp. HCB-162 TaxID=3394234 RepID=UPI0039BC5A0B